MSKNKFFGILAIVILATALILQIIEWKKESVKIIVAGKEIWVEVADAPLKRERGLSGREKLGENKGMLFVFETADYYSFWMKNMKFPIDIVWIYNDRIVDIAKNVPPTASKYLEQYKPKEKANYVLEVKAGTVEEYGWKIGGRVDPSHEKFHK